MPFQQIKDLDLKYALIGFDKDGHERTDDPEGGVFSKTLIEKVKQEQPTNIFFFSHGWKGDVAAAIDQYDRWMGAMWRLKADRDAMGPNFKPMFIGLHWPSQPWGEEKLPSSVSFAEAVLSPDFDALLEETVDHFGDKPGVREALTAIFRAQREDPGARTLPDEVIAAYHDLGKAIGFSAGAGADAPPDAEGEPLNPEEAVRANRVASAAASFGSGGGSGFFGAILGGLRQASFWLMKHRARTVGESGMHGFIAALQNVSNAKIHLMGHSFGCIVVSSILGGPNGKGKLPRPIDSVALVQGALSLWSWGERVKDSNMPGYFHPVIQNKVVAGPVITTQSVHDTAVGVFYPAAVGLVGEAVFGNAFPLYGAIGAFGIQGTVAESSKMQDATAAYNFKPGVIYNLESSGFIKKMDGASGAHSDIDGPEVAHAIWQAASAAAAGQHA